LIITAGRRYDVDAHIAVAGGDTDDVAALYRWLRSDDDLRGRVRLDQPTPGPGEMGALAEIVTVAVSSGGLVTALAGALTGWLAQRRRTPVTVEVAVGSRTGFRTVRIDSPDPAVAERLLREAVDLWKAAP
jgi:hypothetical protein